MRNKVVIFSVMLVAFMFVASQAFVLAEDSKDSVSLESSDSSTDSLLSTSTSTDMTTPPADTLIDPAGTSEITTLKEKTTETETTTTTKTPKKKNRVKKHRQYVK